MLIKLVVKISSLNLISAYRRYTLIVFMTQGYLTAKRLRTTALNTLLCLVSQQAALNFSNISKTKKTKQNFDPFNNILASSKPVKNNCKIVALSCKLKQ